MSHPDLTMDRTEHDEIAQSQGLRQASTQFSPFTAARLQSEVPAAVEFGPTGAISSPFAESLASLGELELETAAFEALQADFEDEEFTAALEALADEVAGRHLSAAEAWSAPDGGSALGNAEAEAWLESVAVRADQVLTELERHFGDRPVDSLLPGEVATVAGLAEAAGPLDAREDFVGKLIGKAVRVAAGVGRLVKRGVQAVGKLVPLGKVFGLLRKLIRPLLQRVLQRAIGRLPVGVRPLATRLAAKFGKPAAGSAAPASAAPAAGSAAATAPDGQPAAPDAAADPAPADSSGESPWSAAPLAAEFDAQLAEALLAPNPQAADELLAAAEQEVQAAEANGTNQIAALDVARQRLADQFVAAAPGYSPVAELEEFIPVVMAAMKLLKVGVRIIGRRKVVDFVAKLLGVLIQGLIGQQAARALSHPIADAGLRLLGLEAERSGDPSLGGAGAGRRGRGHHPRGDGAAGGITCQRTAARSGGSAGLHRCGGPAPAGRGVARRPGRS